MRKIIAALQVSLDGFIEGPQGELDWITSWEDEFEVTPEIDACILGGGMYPGYEQYWTSIIANPDGVLEFIGRPATPGERDYARFAAIRRTSWFRGPSRPPNGTSHKSLTTWLISGG